MHEMSLCEGVIQIIEDHAKNEHFERVKSVCLEIGALSGVEVSALEFCFEVVCRNSIAEGAKLIIDQQPATAWCMKCAEVIEIEQRYDACPLCGGHQIQVTGGDQMRLKELEVV